MPDVTARCRDHNADSQPFMSLKILRTLFFLGLPISWLNSGKCITVVENSGKCVTGAENSGKCVTRVKNSGKYITGAENLGKCVTGTENSGKGVTGAENLQKLLQVLGQKLEFLCRRSASYLLSLLAKMK